MAQHTVDELVLDQLLKEAGLAWHGDDKDVCQVGVEQRGDRQPIALGEHAQGRGVARLDHGQQQLRHDVVDERLRRAVSQRLVREHARVKRVAVRDPPRDNRPDVCPDQLLPAAVPDRRRHVRDERAPVVAACCVLGASGQGGDGPCLVRLVARPGHGQQQHPSRPGPARPPNVCRRRRKDAPCSKRPGLPHRRAAIVEVRRRKLQGRGQCHGHDLSIICPH
jgi:hypothetical protein